MSVFKASSSLVLRKLDSCINLSANHKAEFTNITFFHSVDSAKEDFYVLTNCVIHGCLGLLTVTSPTIPRLPTGVGRTRGSALRNLGNALEPMRRWASKILTEGAMSRRHVIEMRRAMNSWGKP